MAMKKKSKPFGSRRRAKAFWGCVKGVRVRICDKKWLYGSCILKSFSFLDEKHVQIISDGEEFFVLGKGKVKLVEILSFSRENRSANSMKSGIFKGKN
jgi:hypothetical protein